MFVFRAQPGGDCRVVFDERLISVLIGFQAVQHSLATHHHVWRGPFDDGPGLSPVSAESDLTNVSPGYLPSRRGPRGRQAESSRSLGRPLLLRSDVAADAGGESS